MPKGDMQELKGDTCRAERDIVNGKGDILGPKSDLSRRISGQASVAWARLPDALSPRESFKRSANSRPLCINQYPLPLLASNSRASRWTRYLVTCLPVTPRSEARAALFLYPEDRTRASNRISFR